jgi:hypothetical protein
MLIDPGRTKTALERLLALEASYSDLPGWHVYRLPFQEAEEHLSARQQTGG